MAAACWHHASDHQNNIISSQKNHTKIEEYIDETDRGAYVKGVEACASYAEFRLCTTGCAVWIYS